MISKDVEIRFSCHRNRHRRFSSVLSEFRAAFEVLCSAQAPLGLRSGSARAELLLPSVLFEFRGPFEVLCSVRAPLKLRYRRRNRSRVCRPDESLR